MKNRFQLLTFTLFILLSLFCSGCKRSDRVPLIKKGVLDLSNWDLNKEGVVSLDGEWEFYWNQLIAPGDFEAVAKDAALVQVPKPWNRYTINGKKVPNTGYATYRLLVINNKEVPDLAIGFSKAGTSYTLYINGEKISSNGTVSTNPETAVPKAKYILSDVTQIKGNMEIVVHVSNYHHHQGGLVSKIKLGTREVLSEKSNADGMFILIIFACIFTMIFYNILFYTINKRDKSYLYFSLYALCLVINIIILSDYFIFLFFPTISWQVVHKLFSLNFIAGRVFLLMTFYSIYPEEFKKVLFFINKKTVAVILAVVFLLQFIPARVEARFNSTAVITIFAVIYLGVFLSVVATLLLAVKHKRKGSVFLFIGSVIFFLALVNDVLHDSHVIYTGYLSVIAYIIFTLCQNIFLSIRFSKSFLKIEALTKRLRQHSTLLEIKVNERTAELQKAKEQIEEQEAQKTTFYINLMHHIKTPITVLKNLLYKSKYSDDDDILVARRNAEGLADDIMNYLHVEKNQKTGLKYGYDHDLVFDISGPLYKIIKRFSSYKIVSKIEPDVPIQIDYEALKHLVNNIIHNAIKYNDEHVQIEVKLHKEDNHACLTIKDNGIGISHEVQNHIFKPFYQLSIKKSNTQGIGMGLNIVQNIVESVEGTIHLESAADEGAAFFIRIPLSDKPPVNIDDFSNPLDTHHNIKPEVSENAKSYNPSKENILIVEDNIDLVYTLESHFSDHYNTYTANNGKEALKQLEKLYKKQIYVDLIISDEMMDVMSGFEFISELRNTQKYKAIPFIFLTARSDMESKLTGLNFGAVDYIPKPFDMRELEAKVKAHIDHKENILDDFEEGKDKINQIVKNCLKHGLAEQQTRIATLYFKGYSQKSIGLELGISESTVNTTMKKIYKKTRTHNKSELKMLLLAN